MSESELSMDYADLLVEVAAFLGYGSVSTSWSADQVSELDRYVQAGYRRFLYPPAVPGVEPGYSWSFLLPVATLATVSDKGTQDLPHQAARVVGDFHYPQDNFMRTVVQVSEARFQELLSRSESTGNPQCARVRHKEGQDLGGQRLEVAWWPVPDAAYALTYAMESYTGKLDEKINKFPLGGMRHSELLVASCLAVADLRANDERGVHHEEFFAQLAAAIEHDRQGGAQHYGHMGSFSDIPLVPRHGDTGSTYDVSYKGVVH